jgi:hypothetical protein
MSHRYNPEDGHIPCLTYFAIREQLLFPSSDKLAIWREKPVASRRVHMRMIGCCFYMLLFFTFIGAAYGLGHESTLTEPATTEQPITKSQTKNQGPSLLICMLLVFEIFTLGLVFAGK